MRLAFPHAQLDRNGDASRNGRASKSGNAISCCQKLRVCNGPIPVLVMADCRFEWMAAIGRLLGLTERMQWRRSVVFEIALCHFRLPCHTADKLNGSKRPKSNREMTFTFFDSAEDWPWRQY
ncbi:hypothetical protein [Sphingomonas sp. SUN039]|uniref:hypothetical protein n=1 Tax=Sphingomonas sp. SUN039 TaxID=2937787 RepID=UPI002164C272|nr:hypothetical protein [Sphingomonas sp. SUN039]UVO55319.1 hypothetical protein M0209_14735 [Sphingomonas sp. SUN039]